jgi:DNA mismatch repair protein MutS
MIENENIINLEKSIKICHLSLEYNPNTRIVKYIRKIEDGPGKNIYGLEIASSLGIDDEFMKNCYKIRNQIMKKSLFLSNKKSKYNSKVYVDSCFLCGKSETNNLKIETHHIKEQHKADKNGFIDSTHKNIPGNLIEICEECHRRLHSNNLKIIPSETSDGICLEIIS